MDGGADPLKGDRVSALYLSGGNPLLFRDRLRATGLDRWIGSNATSPKPIPIVGASGGAMLLTANLSLFRLLGDDLPTVLRERDAFRGLALADLEVVPHFQSQPAHLRALLPEYAASADAQVWGLDDAAGLACWDDGSLATIGKVTRIEG